MSAALEFLVALYEWAAAGLLSVMEYAAEPYVQARWTVTVT